MEAKLTPAIIVLAVLFGTIIGGPLPSLVNIQTGDLTSGPYWLDMLAATIRSFASVFGAAIGLLAGVWGIPMLRGKSNASDSPGA